MFFSEIEMQKIIKKGYKNITLEEEIAFNILNFIHCIYLNKQDFYSEPFDSQLFGNLEMTFKKNACCLIGHCRAIIKNQNRTIDYLFTENGFELMKDVIKGQN
ncbi:hypothetical protein SAMN05660649_03888 [Desulfotomaculum arcticum]|uniref:Uncharacterized protein n=1 Tax=Desulfotruncus arcticus DSM 17038 TaxID=1121424 RepID=A0A1I2XBY7_9FIRM|nr:hypothetical protein [Desulfotruncus arcticus]SFH10557.1 hypothetical protein SAMN05660649_03888 [Desulfotomaculum arcticum] [Desulfotruncus arcticus DSM 17038]